MKLSTQILVVFTMVILLSIADSYTNTLVHEIAGSIVPGNFKLEIGNLPNLFTERIKLK